MLWLCLNFCQLPLTQQLVDGQLAAANTPRAVFEHRGSHRLLIACNTAANNAGLVPGMQVTAATSRLPALQLTQRSRHSERAALQALATWAGQFSSQVCIDEQRWLLWIEIGASLALFAGMETLLQQVAQGIAELDYRATFGIAPTLEAAALMARHAPQQQVTHRAALRMALASLPIHTLDVEPHIINTLHDIGWRYLGDVLTIPADQLARRFGPALTQYLQRLTGEQPDVRELWHAPSAYQRRVDFADAVHTAEALLFPLRRMTFELQGYLRARDTALQQLTLTLHHRRRHATQLQLHTATPQRDAAHLLLLLREHLERTPLPQPVEALSLAAQQFISMRDAQMELFNTTSQHQQRWAELLDKLSARLGDQAIKRLGLCNDHRPERAWCQLQNAEPDKHHPASDAEPWRPLWLLPVTPLTQPPTLLGKPERIEAGWWNGMDMQRDYYSAQTPTGSHLWLYRDAKTRQWFLHGIWA
jgi:protein ImuB